MVKHPYNTHQQKWVVFKEYVMWVNKSTLHPSAKEVKEKATFPMKKWQQRQTIEESAPFDGENELFPSGIGR